MASLGRWRDEDAQFSKLSINVVVGRLLSPGVPLAEPRRTSLEHGGRVEKKRKKRKRRRKKLIKRVPRGRAISGAKRSGATLVTPPRTCLPSRDKTPIQPRQPSTPRRFSNFRSGNNTFNPHLCDPPFFLKQVSEII